MSNFPPMNFDEDRPRAIALHFRNAVITRKFIDLCKSLGYKGKVKLEGTKYIVTVQALPPKARSALVAKWGDMTVERQGFPKHEDTKSRYKYMTTLTDDSPMPFGKYGPKSKDPRPLKSVPAGYLLWMWEGNAGPELWQKPDDLLHQYIASRFTAIEQDAPDFIVEHRPDVPR
jgi:hypothetical protein